MLHHYCTCNSALLRSAVLFCFVLQFFACRMTPNKKSMAAAFAVFGSSISGLVRWLFGRWVPSWQQLVYNKVLPKAHYTSQLCCSSAESLFG